MPRPDLLGRLRASGVRLLDALAARIARGLVLVLLTCITWSMAEGGTTRLKVATRIVPPMVIEKNGTLSGFSIELWNSIGGRLNCETEYVVMPDVGELLDAVEHGRADLAIAAISITSDRENRFDFSQPIMNSGLQILVRGTAANVEPNPLRELMQLFFSRTLLVWLGIALLLILIPAHLIFLVERHHRNGIIPSTKYFPGIFHAMFWAAGTLATQADQMPRHWVARIVAVLWMFTGVVFVAFYTAQLTASLTVQQIKGPINGPRDLVGKPVGTTRGSTAAVYLNEAKAQVLEFEKVDDLFNALLNQEIDAVVFDAPVLHYYETHDGRGLAKIVGAVFHKEDYGIVFPTGSPLRKHVNEALLALRENDTYQRIYEEWFGKR
ncbi:transporter substrate-binding domain-containing protein [Bradyrhizobium sp.]|jgi:polar amino acid transport system substrate-binding protein|uniref:transporter substrate-binding domain-containing protein n=1 Tax=Bradyrhizobium sp. TaxID=376 RepID=UPI002DDD7D15|nr:transporter substrate-binding domain-containing protein [Bradyrhizobium sp.]HEV2154956.1 transporter substrate-binding domain-containing protein [Bradyrhizobium sp.]